MKIQITSVTSVSDGAGRRYRHGQVVDVDDELATAWIEAGHATRATAKATGAKGGQGKAGQRRATRQSPRTTSTAPAGPPSTPPGESAGTGTTDE